MDGDGTASSGKADLDGVQLAGENWSAWISKW